MWEGEKPSPFLFKKMKKPIDKPSDLWYYIITKKQ